MGNEYQSEFPKVKDLCLVLILAKGYNINNNVFERIVLL